MADPDTLLAFGESVTNRVLRIARERPDARANQFGWDWGHTAEACLIAHARTGDFRFLDWFVASYQDILGFRDCKLGLVDDYRGRITESWGSGRYIPGRWMTHITMGGRIVFPSLIFAEIVLGDPARYEAYVRDAERYVAIAAKVVREYDEDFVEFGEVGRRYYEMPLKDVADTINHVNSIVNSHILLTRLTGDQLSREIATDCCQVFKDSLRRTSSGAYEWSIRPYWVKLHNNRKGERIWKARVSSGTAIPAYKSGIVFTADDMAAFAKTVTEIILVDNNRFRDRVDAKYGRSDEIEDRFRDRMTNIAGFLPWGEFEPSIVPRILHIIETRRDIFKGGPLHKSGSAIAFAYMLDGGKKTKQMGKPPGRRSPRAWTRADS